MLLWCVYMSDRIVYLYSLWGSKVKVYEGSLTIRSTDKHHLNEYAIFHANDVCKTLQCGVKPFIVFNGFVWMEERNDELGKKALIDYEDMQIRRAYEKIENHLMRIQIIKSSELTIRGSIEDACRD